MSVGQCSRPPGGRAIPRSLFQARFGDGMFNEETPLCPIRILKVGKLRPELTEQADAQLSLEKT